MPTIKDLPFNDTPQLSDSVPLYKTASGVTQRTSVNQLLAGGLSSLPVVQPINGSGELWIDPLDGNAIKVAGPANGSTASNLTQTVVNLANGTATDAGTLTGAETVPASRAAGLLQTTLTKIAQWVIQTYAGFTQSGTGAVARTAQGKLRDYAVTPQDFGAIGDGVTDDLAAFVAAINSGAKSVYVPPKQYRLSGGITIPMGVTVYSDSFNPGNPQATIYSRGSCQFIFDLNVATCVTMDGGGHLSPMSLRGILVLRAGVYYGGPNTPQAGSVGILLQGVYQPIVEDVAAYGHAIPIKFSGNANNAWYHFSRVFTGAATDTHLAVDSAKNLTFSDCVFGMNAAGDYNCNNFVSVTGSDSSGYYFIRCLFNQGSNVVTNLINWTALNPATNGHFEFVGCYAETYQYAFTSSSTTPQITRLVADSSHFNSAVSGALMWNLDPATVLSQAQFANCLISNPFTLAAGNIKSLTLTGNTFSNTFSISGVASSYTTCTGNLFQSDITLAGAWGGLSFCGNTQGGGAYSNTATGSVKVLGNTAINSTNVIKDSTTDNLTAGYLIGSAANGITAFAGGGQASATPITTESVAIGTVTTAGDSVILSATAPGKKHFVANRGANACQIFAQGSDQINGIAGSTGVSLAASKQAMFFCSTSGRWWMILSA